MKKLKHFGDNVGAYFTALLKNVDVFEDDTKGITDKQYIVKNARLQFYPPVTINIVGKATANQLWFTRTHF